MKDVGKIILAIIVIVVVWKILKGLDRAAGRPRGGRPRRLRRGKLVEGMGTKRIK